MTEAQFLLTTLLLALATALTRFVPFLLFGNREKTPPFVAYLGKVIPAAMMGLLVVYCFKDTDFSSWRALLPAAAGSVCVVALHLWRRNTILSIAVGTVVYMVLLRLL